MNFTRECELASLEHRLARMGEDEREAFQTKVIRSAALELVRRRHAAAVRELQEREALLADALQLVLDAIDELDAANDLVLAGAQAVVEAA